ncbi:allophanate hydrolase subunit 1 [Methylobacterium sp. GXF4]|uniref:5-oxoprolinase subunit PxpB n=1 Tax=Methylobacterium brachiatum TaxID=269660 RepID=A0ABV1R1J8_9HYPH|nr:5-oxoprolinase subunit PxpB [Methylobacterium sp. GXF4]EIZ81824.1 allophanate hydrolase subunit 1 [Methylobacterium sp. GXF4]
MSEPGYRLLNCGDRALTVELGKTVDPAVNAQVIALDEAIRGAGRPGLLETVPTYRSLLVVYDPELLPRVELAALIAAHWPPPEAKTGAGRRWRIPVNYGGEHGADLASLAAGVGLSPEEVVALHAGRDYRVYMIGFAPGFAYLGGLDPRIQASRRTDPRPKTPAGSVSIGGNQTGVSPPLELPSGWQLIGRTPARSYDPARAEPFLFTAGDLIRFDPIGRAEFDALSEAARAGETVATLERIDG